MIIKNTNAPEIINKILEINLPKGVGVLSLKKAPFSSPFFLRRDFLVFQKNPVDGHVRYGCIISNFLTPESMTLPEEEDEILMLWRNSVNCLWTGTF